MDQWFGLIMSFNLIHRALCVSASRCVCVCVIQCTIDEMRHQEAELEAQMKEQCEDYKELLSEKMARDMEIVAYRSEQSDVSLCLCEAALNNRCSGLHKSETTHKKSDEL